MSIKNVNCCVYGCSSRRGKNPELSFHKFPKENESFVTFKSKLGLEEKMDRRKYWTFLIKTGSKVTEFSRICSLHFSSDDFVVTNAPSIRKRLKKTAVPSLNLPTRIHEKETKQRNPPHKKNLFQVPSTSQQNSPETGTFSNFEHSAAESLLILSTQERSVKLPKIMEYLLKKDIGIQVKSGEITSSFSSKITNKKALASLTGLPTFEILDSLVQFCLDLFGNLCKKRILPVKDCIIFTFMKLRLGLKYVVLSVIFSITEESCRRIFHDYITMLGKIFENLIYWPSREEIQQNMPQCFRKFQSVRVVLDCTEIPLQQSKCLCCRIKTYSQYKKKHTVKFMTGVSPAGLITFVSKGYGGRTSDNEIFKQSKILEKLDSFVDAVMVDKGFIIKDIAEECGIRIIQPPFLKSKKQFSESEALLNVEIARARVHIERVNQRLKIFEILNKPFPYSLLSKVDEIFTIICGVVNLSNPIFSEDKFL